jgi:TonB family protein
MTSAPREDFLALPHKTLINTFRMPRPAHLLDLCFVLLLSPLSAFSQGPMTPARPAADAPRTYDNSPDGLRWQLQDLWNAARENNPARLESLIKQTEVPDPGWFSRAFGPEKGQGWGEAYTSHLAESEKNFEDLMKRLAEEDGQFWVRNIKYEPAPAREVESTLVDSLRLPVNIFFASWKLQDSHQASTSRPVGYFVFIDGRFRWDSAVSPADMHFVVGADRSAEKGTAADQKPTPNPAGNAVDNSKPPYRPGMGGVGYPQCTYCPDPQYSKLARRKQLEGAVLMQVVVQPDGSVTDAKVVKSPDAELSDAAIQAVSLWRFKPARLPDGEAVPTVVAVEMNFRLLH